MTEKRSFTSRCRPTRRRVETALLLTVCLCATAPGSLARAQVAGDADPDQPIARLDGQTIKLAEVEPDIAFQIYRLRIDIYSLLKKAVSALVEDRLLAREATRRGISVDELTRVIESQAKPASASDVDDYLDEHPEALSEPNARERISYYLSERRRIQAKLDFMEQLRQRARFELLVEAPSQPRVRVPTEGAPARGPQDAPVVLVHFASLTSARSARSAQRIRRLESEFPGRILWVHYSLPADHDELALAAAQLAAAARDKGRFWELHDRLLALEGRVKLSDLETVASDVGLRPVPPGDTSQLDTVKRETDVAARVGIEREPVIFVNGRYYSPTFPYEQLRALVAEELGSPAAGANATEPSPN